MRAFVNYVYQDWLDARIGPDLAVEVVHVAQYFGCPRLSALCEVILVKGLKAGDPRDPGAFHLPCVLLPHAQTGVIMPKVPATSLLSPPSLAWADPPFKSRLSALSQHSMHPAQRRA